MIEPSSASSPSRPAAAAPSGDIVFVEHFQPSWLSGDFAISAVQAVSSDDPTNSFSDSFSGSTSFAVQGPHFSLPPDRIDTQFPPDGGNGAYTNVLPHIVLTDETLPWQRSPGGAADPDRVRPWIALLVFDRDDPGRPTVRQGTVDVFLPANLPAGGISYPDLPNAFEYGDWTKDGYAPCRYVDIPGTLFSAIAPSLDDLYWLAHARQVSEPAMLRKPVGLTGSPDARLSVVVGNRLPTPASETLCCLVSLEAMADWLPPNALPEGSIVRLAVLASWQFGCLGDTRSLDSYFQALDKQPSTLQMPPPASSDDGPGAKAVTAALAMGYTAFTHQTRQGSGTVSWYRGPLIPYDNLPVLEPPFANADALLRYDPAVGMLDGSYAAAWQLGQLLALADQSFATTLYNWKLGQQQAAVDALEAEILAKRLGLPTELLKADGAKRSSQLMRAVLKPMLADAILKGDQP